MQLHQLKPNHKPKRGKRIGRGGKKGTYSGKGIKGQNSRSGRLLKPLIRDVIKRYPKLRGHRSIVRPRFRISLNLSEIDKSFKDGEAVTLKALAQKGLVSFLGKKTPEIKILGQGELTRTLNFEGFRFSRSAQEKIKKAGGSIETK
ncbi:MAG: 50S ribosomal protein L15 [bacterium]|nr:50S ribosomal protein L15 [bacterium]